MIVTSVGGIIPSNACCVGQNAAAMEYQNGHGVSIQVKDYSIVPA